MHAELTDKLKQLRSFLRDGVWDTDISQFSLLPAILIRILRVVILMLRGIKDDELPIRASALTFVTLVSIVPILSIAFSISEGLDLGEDIVKRISDFAKTQPEKVQEVINQIIDLVENTNFQSLGWSGLVFLMITATLVLNGLEKTLNRIWGISHSRNMIRRIANYISLLVVVPIAIGIAGTVQGVVLSGHSGAVGIFESFFLQSAPFLSGCLGLTLLYVMLPNVKVRFIPALISGLVAVAVWMIWQSAFISLQLSVVKYNPIYGTFAALPIFLVWLYTSWVIVLLGAEVSFAVQYHNTLHLERGALGANVRVRQLLALSIMRECASRLYKEEGLFDKTKYAEGFKVPIRLVNDIVELLVEHGLVVPVSETQNCYVLSSAPSKVGIKQIIDIVEKHGKGLEDFGLEKVEPAIRKELEMAEEGMANTLDKRSLADLVENE